MYEPGGYKAFHCTISEYCRTRIFEFPRIEFRPNGDAPHHTIYSSPSVQGSISANLMDYFESSTPSKHYAISPSLRYEVSETDEKVKSQQTDHTPVFLVIEEFNHVTPISMVNGECSISDEVVVRDGKAVPILIGGREGEQFVAAWATTDGVWPNIPNNQQPVNMILAGVRVGQQTPGPIGKHLDQDGLVTDNGRFVEMIRPTMSMRGSTATPMDTKAYGDRASEIRTALAKPEYTDRSLKGRDAGLAESSAGVPASAGRCRSEQARLGGAEVAGARVREACSGMLARASDPGRRCERASGRERYRP